jgi:hypothetical protein
MGTKRFSRVVAKMNRVEGSTVLYEYLVRMNAS